MGQELKRGDGITLRGDVSGWHRGTEYSLTSGTSYHVLSVSDRVVQLQPASLESGEAEDAWYMVNRDELKEVV